MIKLFNKKNKANSSLLDKVNEYIDKTSKYKDKTFLFVKFAHKDKRLSYHICELLGDIVVINECSYYISSDNLYTFEYVLNKDKHKITTCDIYEGITTGYNPFEERLSNIYNEKVQKAIYLYLITGIMETKAKHKTNIKTIIIAGLLGLGALFVIFKMFGGN